MGDRSRRKGLRGEAEVAELLRRAGFDPKGLEAGGDWLCISVNGRALHFEVKRGERQKMPEWRGQARDDAPAGAVPIVAARRNREPWYVDLPLEDFLELIR